MNFRQALRSRRSQKGFTLIELLVVIGILGILAAGLLLTIDPLEKFRQGNDSNTQQTSTDLFNAITAYYSSHTAFPWDDSSATPPNCLGVGVKPNGTPAETTFDGCLKALIAAGELKSTFTSNTNLLSTVFVTEDANNNVSVCFAPTSKSLQTNGSSQFNKDGTAWTSPNPKYWCAK